MKPIPPAEFVVPAADAPAPVEAEGAAAQSFVLQWQALHRAAEAVATLANASGEPDSAAIASFPERVTHAGGWRMRLARQGAADLAAVMEPGLSALIAVHARGANPQPAARALLEEFTSARDALLGLAPGR